MQATDSELMLRVRLGDTRAFGQLVERYRGPLRQYLCTLIQDRFQAEDLAQETFLRLWLLREKYEARGSFSALLYRVARNLWLNERRRSLARPSVELGSQIACAGSPEETMLASEQSRITRHAIAALRSPCADVARLRCFAGLSYHEIALRLGIAEGTAKSRMWEARRTLQRALQEIVEEE